MALKPAPFTELTDADAILNFIFDPHRSFIGAVPAPPAPPATGGATGGRDPAAPLVRTPEEVEYSRISVLEQAAVTVAEGGDFGGAIALFDAIVADSPRRASAYNNRAQARRLAGDAEGAKADLDAAVELAHAYLKAGSAAAGEGAGDVPTKPEGLIVAHRSVLKQAYTQRAVYYHGVGNSAAEEADLHAAAAYGSTMARMMTTGTNPFAALCSSAFMKMTGGGGASEEGAPCSEPAAPAAPAAHAAAGAAAAGSAPAPAPASGGPTC